MSDSATPSISLMSVPSTTPSSPKDDPSVIVGLACRVPGATSPSQLWDLIKEKRDVQKKMPTDRFNIDAFHHPNGSNKGTTNAQYGYFLDQDLGTFDPSFFNISGNEAEAMDPQQRLLLEVVYEALEDAGITLESIKGTQTSVFCGSFTNDYEAMSFKDLEYYPKYAITGTGNSILSNRISYFYDLHGASATLDTACSSSLVCFHLGNQTLQNDEATISIVVGSALHFDPSIYITMTDLGMLSSDGRCRAFDAAGRGYVRGEGICAAILKRKSHAEMDGDTIRAIVRGTGTNHDGTKQGITLPSSESQEALIRQTYNAAGLNPRDTAYFEAHGTGTPAGDPRETRAIGAVFAPLRDDPLFLGSVKTNIGHLEGASGIAALIKATLSLEACKIPPNMHFNNPNPNIDFEAWKLKVPTEMLDWNSPNGLRRASINSFGYGGTNAHVILEGYYPKLPKSLSESSKPPDELLKLSEGRPYLFPLTSHSKKTGQLAAESLADFLELHDDEINLLDFAHTLSTRRTMHKVRAFAIGSDQEALIGDLADPPPAAAWTSIMEEKPRLGFVFTGQGGQWFAMGRQLIEKSPLFKQTMERCNEVLQSLPDRPDWDVVQELSRSKELSRLMETRFSQPLCTALQLGICTLFSQWGIEPDAVVGHSSGEIGAAYSAGILSFENAMIAAYYRGLHMSEAPKDVVTVPGAMMAVGLSEPDAREAIGPYTGRIAIAAINSPSSITLSGDEDAIIELKEILVEKKVFARQLQVAQAFHSHHMFGLAPAYQTALENCATFRPLPAQKHMYSSVNANLADPEVMGPKYWVQNMTGTVHFYEALSGILTGEGSKGIDILIEIGPHPALKGPSRQTLQSLKLDIPYLSSLTRGTPDFEGLLTAAGQLFARGYPVDLSAVNSDIFVNEDKVIVSYNPAKRVRNLPSYSWDHSTRYWGETRVLKEHRLRKHRHSILGASILGSVPSNPRWRNYLRQSELPWLVDHKIEGKVIFPAAGYITMAIEAVIRLEDRPVELGEIALKDLVFRFALELDESAIGIEVILDLRPVSISAKSKSNTWYEFSIFSFDPSGRQTENCSGLISAGERTQAYLEPKPSPKKTVRATPSTKYYKHIAELGLQYGETFALLSGAIENGPGFATSSLAWDPAKFSDFHTHRCVVHPALLDASFHTIFAAIEGDLGRHLTEPLVPTFIRSLKIFGTLSNTDYLKEEQNLPVFVDAKMLGPRVATSDLSIKTTDGSEVLLDIQGLELTALGGDSREVDARTLYFRTRWQSAFEFLQNVDVNALSGIADVMDVFTHQYPDTKILHFTNTVDSSREVLSRLGGRPGERRRFKSITPVAILKDSDLSFEALTTEWPSLIDVGKPTEAEYDVVVLDEGAYAIRETFSQYLKDGGYLISRDIDVGDKYLAVVFQAEKFRAWRKKDSNISPNISQIGPITFVLSEQPSSRTQTIVSGIAALHNGSVSTTSLKKLLQLSGPLPENLIVMSSLDEDLLFDDDNDKSFNAVRKLLTSDASNILWFTDGATIDSPKPQSSLITGLARVVRSENEALRLVLIDISPSSSTQDTVKLAVKALHRSLEEDELSERNGQVLIPRVEADDSLNCKLPNGVLHVPRPEAFDQRRRPLSLKVGKIGLLDSLVFDDDFELFAKPLGKDEVEIKTFAASVNARDIAAATGAIDSFALGEESAGIIIRIGSEVDASKFHPGDRVVALRPGQGAHQSIVRNPVSWTLKIKDEMSFAKAVSLPSSLLTAYYAIRILAQLQLGETVLIHHAASEVGQVAIQLAQMLGGEIFATVISEEQRDLLATRYSLNKSNVYIGDETFVHQVLKSTGGKGVDVILNTLSGGSALHSSISCTAPFGRFIELGESSIREDAKLSLGAFRRGITFSAASLSVMFTHKPTLGARLLQECWELLNQGAFRISEVVNTFSFADVAKAYRAVQSNKITDKVVLVAEAGSIVPAMPPTYRNTPLFSPSKTYLLIGGLGGLGRSLAEFLYQRGARSLAFFSRSGADRPEAKATLTWLKEREVKVIVYRGDVADAAAVRSCVSIIGDSLAGIFQAAMVLHDSPFETMTHADWLGCIRPKVQGTLNLHTATTELQSNLDFFICFSSVSCIFGGKGLANYSAANCYLDALMRHRRHLGLPGTVMNAGMVVNVGVVAETASLQSIMERNGFDPISETELLYQIEEAVLSNNEKSLSERGIEQSSTISGLRLSSIPYFATNPLLRNLYSNHSFTTTSSTTSTSQDLHTLLSTAASAPERQAILLEAFIAKIGTVLGIDPDSIVPTNKLAAYGLDSIVAVEFRTWFSRVVRVELPLFEILNAKSIVVLVEKAVEALVIEA